VKNRLGVTVDVRREGNTTLRPFGAETAKRDSVMWTDIEFADDLELMANTTDELQRMLVIIDDICTKFGQTISIKKTAVMAMEHKLPLKKGERRIVKEYDNIFLRGEIIQRVDSFLYLGRMLNSDGTMVDNFRIARHE